MGDLLVQLASDNPRKYLGFTRRQARHQGAHGVDAILLLTLLEVSRQSAFNAFKQGFPCHGFGRKSSAPALMA